MHEVINSPWLLRSNAFGVGIESVAGDKASGFETEFGEVLSPVALCSLDDLKRSYASLIIQLDRLKPKLASTESLASRAEGAWSIKEILGHLIDSDREIWWPRITAILQQDHPNFQNVDQQALLTKNNWRSLPLDDIFAQLMRTRWNFATRLQEIPADDFEKTGCHPTLGEISILRILQILVAHDAHYVTEIRMTIEANSTLFPHAVS